MANAAYVKSEWTTVATFLVDEWLPSRRPPVLEEITWSSYERYIRLHVVPHVGGIQLQRVSPVDLNRLYRHLLEVGRRPPTAHAEESAPARGVRPRSRAPGGWMWLVS
jgi:hypothetical protein